MPTTPTRVAIVGLGGFATAHHRALLKLEEEGCAVLVATCDPRAAEQTEVVEAMRFAKRGVPVLPSLDALLAAHHGALDLITLPTPVPLHAPMHRTCVERGLPVYLEKPPSLDPDELESMIAVDARAKVPTWVGFNFIRDAVRQEVKRRILAGEFGRLREVRISALWPRGDAYYGRADWAGRLELRGRLVLDGPLGNAMAHLVHDGLHWAGAAQDAWGQARRVRASLLRAHRIQGADTALVEVDTGGAALRLAVTHANVEHVPPVEELHCDLAVIRFQPDLPERCRIIRPGRDDEVIADRTGDHLVGNLRAACAIVRDGVGRPATALADSRPFVHVNALAHISTGGIGSEPTCDGTIPGVEGLVATFLSTGAHPVEQGLTWAPNPAWVGPEDLPRLGAAIKALAAAP